jgi:peptide/nickel transport system substrate-binding protein/oligopeptide transport system substrate-binding protein
MVPYNIYDRLVEKITDPATREPKVVEGLAESWSVSPDGKVYTFKLRKGAKFSDGSEVKASDVVFSFDRNLNPATKSIQTDGWDLVLGARERLDGKAESTSGIKALDDYTVEITMTQVYPPFLEDIIAAPMAAVYSEKFVKSRGNKFGLSPEDTMGSGPFILTEWVVDNYHVMEANPNYWRGKPGIDKVRINVVSDAETARLMFETGDIDIFDCDVARSQIPYFESSEKWKNRIVKSQRIGLYYYAMNTAMKPFDDVRVRRAFTMAVPRKELLDNVFFGKGVLPDNILPKGTEPYNPNPTRKIVYDPAGAKKLLEEAGYKDGVEIEISYSNQGASGRNWAAMAEIMQAMLPSAGFKVKINQMDEASFIDTRNSGNIMCYSQSWSTADPDAYFSKFFYSERWSTYRSINTKDPKLDKMIMDARVEVDSAKRVQLYRELDDYVTHDVVAMLPLFNMEHLFVLSDKVKDFVPNWKGWGDCMLYWTTMN